MALYLAMNLGNFRDGYPTRVGGGDKRGVVALGLVGVGLSESRDRTVKLITCTQIATYLRRITGASMGASKCPSTETNIQDEIILNEVFKIWRPISVAQLADVAVGGFTACPTKKNVGSCLHQSLPTDDPLCVVGIATGS